MKRCLPSRSRSVFLAVLAMAGRAMAEGDGELIDRIEREVGDAQKRLLLVRQYADKGDIAPLDRANQRFSEAETQFLLDNFDGCASMLLDVMDVAEFKEGPKYPQALYYLAESFYKTEAYLESLRYYRLALLRLPPGKVYQDALVRLLDLSDRTGDYTGIDQSFEALQRSGNARPEVTYIHAKWLANRRDLPLADRVLRADVEFSLLGEGQPFHPQATYFRGALRIVQVQALQNRYAALARKERPGVITTEMESIKPKIDALLEEAAALQQSIIDLPEPARPDVKLKKARGLANMALARIYYEQGKHAEAADRYSEVAQDSDDYNDALYETTASYVKMGNHEQALRTLEILLDLGRDSTILPEARIMEANLLLKLQQFDRAETSFNEVANNYSPVYSQIQALLTRPDPIDHFDEILRRTGKDSDILQILPAPARPFVNVDRQMGDARTISSEVQVGKRGIEESRALARKLIEALDSGRLQLFPQLQEGNTLAIEQSNRLVALEGELVKLQLRLLGDRIPQEIRDGLGKIDEERQKLDQRFQNMPKSQEQYADRKASFLRRIGELDKLAFSLANRVSELRANLVGLQHYWKSTRDQRTADPTREAERQAEFAQNSTLIDQLEEERLRIVDLIERERETIAGQAIGGELEEDLRIRYSRMLASTGQLVTKALPFVPETNRPLLERVQKSRAQIEQVQSDLAALRGRMRERAAAKADEYRREVFAQQEALEGYQREVDGMEGRTRHLLGEIAYDSLSRVGRQFYELVLKADVGIIDVAWSRKRERSDRISEFGRKKESEIVRLQDLFKEVLNDAD